MDHLAHDTPDRDLSSSEDEFFDAEESPRPSPNSNQTASKLSELSGQTNTALNLTSHISDVNCPVGTPTKPAKLIISDIGAEGTKTPVNTPSAMSFLINP
ncbi:hypothetical protein SARC_15276, partial [Sphaeroforma arctica JP610]